MEQIYSFDEIKQIAQTAFDIDKADFKDESYIKSTFNKLVSEFNKMLDLKRTGDLEHIQLPLPDSWIDDDFKANHHVKNQHKYYHELMKLDTNFYDKRIAFIKMSVSIYKHPLYLAYRDHYLLKPYLESIISKLPKNLHTHQGIYTAKQYAGFLYFLMKGGYEQNRTRTRIGKPYVKGLVEKYKIPNSHNNVYIKLRKIIPPVTDKLTRKDYLAIEQLLGNSHPKSLKILREDYSSAD